MMVQETHHRNRQLALPRSRAERKLILILRAATKPVPGTLQEGGAPFQTTHWTVVLKAAKADSDESRKALSTFSEAYWPPLYAFIRCRGYPSSEAQDLTQSFFGHLLEHETQSRRYSSKNLIFELSLGNPLIMREKVKHVRRAPRITNIGTMHWTNG